MAIEKAKLHEITRDRWPLSFLIIPAEYPSYRAEPEMWVVYRSIEESCQPKGQCAQGDEWSQLANWAFHQALDALATAVTEESINHREDVTFSLFDECMRSNLADESWAEERREYEASPSRFH